MIGKVFIVSILSAIIFLVLLSLLTWIISPIEFSWEELLQIFFYGSATLVPLVFVILIVLNLLIQWRIKVDTRFSPNKIYFLWSIILAILPVLGFVIFDYAHRGRSFEKETFLGISSQYSVTFVLALIAILLNRKIVWNNFRKHEPDSRLE